MSSPELQDELSYHLRELRADLGLVRSNLEAAAASGQEPAAVRSWIQAEALLAHDLEVHLPRALAILGLPAPSPAPYTGHRAGNAAVPASIAREARQLVESSHAALREPESLSSAPPGLLDVARRIQAAYRLVLDVQQALANNDQTDEQD